MPRPRILLDVLIVVLLLAISRVELVEFRMAPAACGCLPRHPGVGRRVAPTRWPPARAMSRFWDAIQIAAPGVVTVRDGAVERLRSADRLAPARAAMYPRVNGRQRMSSREQAPRDEELMRQVADGSEEALGLLHRRFARLIFSLAVQTLDRATAEDLVQDVFLAAWRNAGRFEPERGTFRAWVLQIAHFRLLNELRRRSRQPEIEPDPEGLVLAGVPASDPGPAEATW